MPRKKITIFDPIEIEIGDQVFSIKSLSPEVMENMRSFQDINSADFGKIAEKIKTIFPEMTIEFARSLDLRQMVEIMNYISNQVTDGFSGVTAEEKNGSTPGNLQ